MERAAAVLAEALALARPLADRTIRAKLLYLAGDAAQARGDCPAAAALHLESLALRRALGDKYGSAIALAGLARALRELGDVAQALALYCEALVLHRDRGNTRWIARCLGGLAALTGAQHPIRAARLWGAAETLREALAASVPPAERAEHEHAVAAVRAALGPEAFAAAWAAGKALSPDEAVAEALALGAAVAEP